MNESKKVARRLVAIILHGVMITVIAVGFIFVSNTSTQELSTYKNSFGNNRVTEFSALMNSVEELNKSLENTLISSDTVFMLKNLAEVSKTAGQAAGLLSGMPFSHVESAQTVDYLNTVAEFSVCLIGKLSGGEALSSEDRTALESFQSSSMTFNDELSYLYQKSADPTSKYNLTDNVDDIYYNEGNNYASAMFSSLNKGYEGYPQINYDGAYSSHMDNLTYKALSDSPQMSSDDVLEKMNGYFSDNDYYSEYKAEYLSDTVSGIPGYSYNVSDGQNNMNAVFSSSGGHLISLYGAVNGSKATIDTAEALERAKSFLESIGITDMVNTYHTSNLNTVSFDFIAREDDYSCCGDRIKVMVSLTDGGIVGYDAQDYYTLHTKRENSLPRISENDALKNLPEGIKIKSIKKAYHNSAGNTETLCYEIITEYNKSGYIYYVDANDASVLEVMRINEDEKSFYAY